MRTPTLPRLGWALFGAVALLGSVGGESLVARAATPRGGEGVIVGRPPPPVRGAPGGPSPFPCALEGTLNDGRAYVAPRTPLRAAMIFVDFSDAEASPEHTPQSLYDGFVGPSHAAFQALSYGSFDVSVTPLRMWVRMPKPFAGYGYKSDTSVSTYKQQHAYITDAIRAADPHFDFSPYSAVYVVAAPAAGMRAAADGGETPESSYVADRHRIANAVNLGSSSEYYRGYQVLVHETEHLVGLPDLYAASGPTDFMGPWDIMSVVGTPTTPMTSWSRLLGGWLRRGDFRCLKQTSTADLTPVTETGGLKGVVIPKTASSAWVVEARTDAVGVDDSGNSCRRDGVLLYGVSTTAQSGEGPLRLVDSARGAGACGEHTNATFLAAGPESQYRSPDGRFLLRVLGTAATGFRIEVRLPLPCRAPRLTGKTLAQAKALLRNARCRLGAVRRAARAVRHPVVVDQRPRAGSIELAGARVGVRLGRRP